MSSLEDVRRRCLAVCDVPIEVSVEIVCSPVKRHLLNGQILDTNEVDRGGGSHFKRLVLLCSSEKDVDRICREIKNEEIQIENRCAVVKYQKALPSEIPNRWEHFEIPEKECKNPQLCADFTYVKPKSTRIKHQRGHMFPAPKYPNIPHQLLEGRGKSWRQNQHAGLPPLYNDGMLKGQSVNYSDEVKSSTDELISELECVSDAVDEETAEGTQEPEMSKEKPTKIIMSNLPSSIDEEYLEMFFEDEKKYGGVSVFHIDLDEENATAVVEFEEPEAIDIVLNQCPLIMMRQEVEVSVFKPQPFVPPCTIEITGPSSVVCEDQLERLEMYFKSERRSGGGDVVECRFDAEKCMVLVTFGNEEAAQRVAARGNHIIKNKNITVKLHTHAIQSKTSGKTDEAMEDSRRTIKVKGIDKLSSRDTVVFYFENRRRSGGGNIEKVCSDEEDRDVIYITFENKQDAENVVRRVNHKVEGRELCVSPYIPPIPPPFYENKILVKGLKPTTTQDCLFNFIEAKSGFIPETMDYHAEHEDVVLVTFTDNADFQKLEKVFRKNKLEGALLKVYPVPVSNCISVANLASEFTKDTVEFYFENTRRSGGGPVKNVVMNEDDTCLVHFDDYAIIEGVLDRTHTLGRQTLDVKRYHECLGRPETVLMCKPEPPVPEENENRETGRSEEPEVPGTEDSPTKIVVSNLPSTVHEEYLEMFFDNTRKFGGGPVFNIEFDEENATAVVEFEEPEAVDIVLNKCPIKMMNKKVEVTVYKPEPHVPLCTVEVTGSCSVVCEAQLETLEMYFENERRSGGGSIVDCKFDSENNMVLVTFETEEVAQRVEEKGSHVIKKENINVKLHVPTKVSKRSKKSDKTVEVVEEKQETPRTVKVKGVDKSASRDTVELYFENTKRSGGGNIEKVSSDEEEDDVIYVTFENEQDAENVVKRGHHTVEGKELSVSVYVPPVPPPSYENKILIKGLKPTTTQDCLFNFIEAKSGFTPDTMDYHAEQEDVVMVTFTEDADFKKFEKIFEKATLEGASLKVYPVPISNCIIVDNLASEVTKDTVEFYFENTRKSGNGTVEKVVMNEDDTCLVYFADYTIIDSVLARKHVLSNQQLDVKRYQECLGRPEGEGGERILNIPDPIEVKEIIPQKLTFLTNSELNREAVETQLLSCHTLIVWPPNVANVTLKCTLTKNVKDCFKLVKTWKKEAEESFDHFLNRIAIHQISVLQYIWQKVMEKMQTITIKNPETVAVVVDKKEGFVTVVGNKPPAESLAKDITDIVQKVMEEAEKERQKVKEPFSNLKSIETKMLLASKFPSMIEELFPDIKVKINQGKNEVVFEGTLANVRDAKLKMFEIKNDFAQRSVESMPSLSAGLFKTKQTKDYIVKKLKRQSVTGVWEVQGQTLLILSTSEKALVQCVSIIRESVLERSIGLTKASASLMNSEDWQSRIKEWHSQHAEKASITVDDSMSSIKICSTDDIANELLDGVKKFLRFNTVLEEKIPCSRNLHRLIEKHHKPDISEICKQLKVYHVNITSEGYGGFRINGTEVGMIRSREMLYKVFEKVKKKDHTVSKPGLVEHMKTPRGKDSLNTIESTMPCVISVKEECGEEQTSENLYESIPTRRRNRNTKITVKAICNIYDRINVYTAVGDMTEMSMQVLVKAADENLSLRGSLGKAMALKGGKKIEKACEDYIHTHKKFKDGETFVCTAGNMAAEYIIHVKGPVWKGGHEKEEKILEEAVFKCMQEASLKDATSIAVPAISCGNYGYPVKRATTTIVKAVKKFYQKVHDSKLTDIYLCDVKPSTVDCFTDALKREFGNVNIVEEDENETHSDRSQESRYYTSQQTEEMTSDDEYYTASSKQRKPPPGAVRGAPTLPKTNQPKRKPGSDSNDSNLSVTLKKGEIATEKVDVIINTTAKNLDLKNGAVSASLLKIGGQGLQADVSTNYPNGINFGEIAVSGGHNLKCSHVYHTTLSNFDANNFPACIEALHNLMTSCLNEAQKQNQTSVAFPAIGTGSLGFPKDVVAKEMFKAVSKFSTSNTNSSVKDVRIIVYQKDLSSIKAFEAEQKRWSSGEYRSDRQSRKVDPIYERLQCRKPDTGADDEHEYDFLTNSAESTYVNLKVTVRQGDITKEDSDCIVNSSNEAFDLTRGAVSKALLKKGGDVLAKEIKSKKDTMRRKHLVWTSAPGVPCNHIVHVVAQNNNKEWKSIIDRCLRDAEEKQLKSIAFPALGTGFQSEPKEMADVMACAFEEFDKSKPASLKDIRIVVFQQDMVQDFQRVLLTDGKQNYGILNAIYNGVKGFFGGGKGGAYDEAGSGKKKPENPDSVTFEILSMNNNVIQEAIKRLEGCLEKEIHRKEFKESIISRMDPNFIAEIEAIARENNVKIDTDVKAGKIQMPGMAQNLMNASDKIHGIMRDAVAQEKQRETAEIMSCLVQWFYIEITEESGQKLVEYDKTLNFKIESAFKSQEPTFSFIADDKKKYILDFKKMQEYAENDAEVVVNVIRRDLFKEGASDTPASWGDFKGNLKVVNLPNTDPEYLDICQKFQASAGARQVKQIQRIQNKTLWNQFHAKKKQLEDQNQANTQNEHFLWHGTAEEAVDSINAHGFNRSYCGKNATALGNGVYFAVQAAYSCQDTYSRPDGNGFKRMYYCRVLTGEYTGGSHGMRVPPPKPTGGSNAIYDSVVDNVNGPGIYVIFNDTQAFPEYLVTFS